MNYILIAFAACIGLVAYLSIGLLFLALAPFSLFKTIAEMGDTQDYWNTMWLWPLYLIVNCVFWAIDKVLEE